MKYSNELKIGAVIVLSALIFYIGTRFLKDLPIFTGTYEFSTRFADAGGLVSGNAVRINGVNVGSVKAVLLDEGAARIVFGIDKTVPLTYGSTAAIGGIGSLGVVRLEINLGPADTTAFVPGDEIPSAEASGFDKLLAEAPQIVGRADSLIIGATQTLASARTLIDDPQSNLAQTLVAVQGSANALNSLLRSEQARIAGVLESVQTLTGNLNTLTGDTLQATVQNVNQLLARIDGNMASLEATTTSLNTLLTKINQGQGTLGLLINDATLYNKLDSTLVNLNRILLDFERNPKKYLKDLKLVDIF